VAFDGGTPTAGDEKGKGRSKGGVAQVERLTKELGLTAEQRARVETVLADTRAKMGGVSTEDQAERRRSVERLRAESRARIAEVLTPEQRGRYEALAGGGRARSGSGTSGRVWVADEATGKPRMVPVRLGLSDGSYSELLSGDLKEGDQVILGLLGESARDRSKAKAKGGPRFGF
jgi:HlyD family secretion protein